MLRWKTGSYPTGSADGTQGYFDTSNSTTITGLPAGTAIYVAVFDYGNTSGYYSSGSTQATEATTAATDPTVTTDNATGVTFNSAQLNATISALDCSNASDVMFEWGTSTGVYTDNWTAAGSYGNVAFNHTPTLSDNTTYFYRGGARLSGGAWQYGSEVSFYTLTIVAPTVTTSAASSIGDIYATLGGEITDTGGENADLRFVEWGLSSGNYSANQTSGGSYGTGGFSFAITTLTANTTYYFRAGARNPSGGIGYGAEDSFSTLSIVPPPVTTPATEPGEVVSDPGSITALALIMSAFLMLFALWDEKNDYHAIVTSVALVFIGLDWLDNYLLLALCALAVSPYFLIRVIFRAIKVKRGE